MITTFEYDDTTSPTLSDMALFETLDRVTCDISLPACPVTRLHERKQASHDCAMGHRDTVTVHMQAEMESTRTEGVIVDVDVGFVLRK